MKTLGSFLNKKNLAQHAGIDQQTVFYVFQRFIKEEYGRQGIENIVPLVFREKKIFIKISGSIWANEISLRKRKIVDSINKELGGDEIIDLAISN